MAGTSQREIKLFYCYAREDKPLRDELEKHLAWLKRRYQLTNWHDREILPGEEWEQAIDRHLNTANLILLLISPDFMASEYCYGKEMKRALERHQAGTCRVIPILLRPTYWEGAPFSTLQLLPTDARPITRWPDRDEAFQDVVTAINRTIEDPLTSPIPTAINRTIEDLLTSPIPTAINRTIKDLLVSFKTKEDWFQEGDTLLELRRYEEALAAFEQAISLDPNDAIAYNRKGYAFLELRRYEEALAAFEQAISLDPNDAIAYNNKGWTLNDLKRYEEALAACEQAIHLNPNFALAYNNKGVALHYLKRYQEAGQAFEKARQLGYRSQ